MRIIECAAAAAILGGSVPAEVSACTVLRPEIGSIAAIADAKAVPVNRAGDRIWLEVNGRVCALDSIEASAASGTVKLLTDGAVPFKANQRLDLPSVEEMRRGVFATPERFRAQLERERALYDGLQLGGALGDDSVQFGLDGLALGDDSRPAALTATHDGSFIIPLTGVSASGHAFLFAPAVGDAVDTADLAPGDHEVRFGHVHGRPGLWRIKIEVPGQRLLGGFTMSEGFAALHDVVAADALGLDYNERAMALACADYRRYGLEAYWRLESTGDAAASLRLLRSWREPIGTFGCATPRTP